MNAKCPHWLTTYAPISWPQDPPTHIILNQMGKKIKHSMSRMLPRTAYAYLRSSVVYIYIYIYNMRPIIWNNNGWIRKPSGRVAVDDVVGVVNVSSGMENIPRGILFFFIAFFDNTKTVVIRILCVDKGKCALLQRRSRVENDAYVHGDTHTDANTHIHKREPFAICI